MSVKLYCFIALILSSILGYVTATVIGHGHASPTIFLAFVVAMMSVVGFGAYIETKGWA